MRDGASSKQLKEPLNVCDMDLPGLKQALSMSKTEACTYKQAVTLA